MNERGLSSGIQLALLLPVAFGIFLGVLQWALMLWAEAGMRGVATEFAWQVASHRAAGHEQVKVEGVSNLDVDIRRGTHNALVTVRGDALRVLPFVDTHVVQSVQVPTERLS